MAAPRTAAFKAEMERGTPRGPTVNEMACIRKVAEERVWRTKQAMQQRGALAAKQAADRAWKHLGKEMPCTVYPPAVTHPVSSRWERWPGATAAELAEAERMQMAQIRGKVPLGRLEVRADEPPPPPLPPAPKNWKPVDWMNTEHYKQLAFGPNASPRLKAKLQAFKAEGAEPKAGGHEDEDGTRTPAVVHVAPEKGPSKGLAANCEGDDPKRKRLGTALYKRIVARVPSTSCPDRKVLQVGLRAHKHVMEMDICGLKRLLGKPAEAFDMELEHIVGAVLSAEEIAEPSQRPDNPSTSDDSRMYNKVRLPLGTAICYTRRARHILSDARARSRGRNGSSPCLLPYRRGKWA
jgi:hypothetical protein